MIKPQIDALNSTESEGYGERSGWTISASLIGDECRAFLMLSLRGFPSGAPSPRLQRIFTTGHLLEDMVIEALRESGLHIVDKDHMTGKQFKFSMSGGHAIAKVDGIITIGGVDGILEIKTMNAKKWKEFTTKGVKKSHPKYYFQAVMSMGLAGMTYALIVAMNKDTSELAFEEIEFDPMEWGYIKAKVDEVIGGNGARRMANPDNFICRGCFKRDACWFQEKIPEQKHCRACRWARPDTFSKDGKWFCDLKGVEAKAKCEHFVQFVPQPKPE